MMEVANSQQHKEGCKTMNKEDFAVGDYLYCSWGYDQTNIDFCQIIEVSKSRKTVKCQMCSKEVVRNERTADYVKPSKRIGKITFRLWVRRYKNWLSFRGQYPFCGDHPAMRMGSFSKWDGKPEYETALGFGH